MRQLSVIYILQLWSRSGVSRSHFLSIVENLKSALSFYMKKTLYVNVLYTIISLLYIHINLYNPLIFAVKLAILESDDAFGSCCLASCSRLRISVILGIIYTPDISLYSLSLSSKRNILLLCATPKAYHTSVYILVICD